MRVRDGTSAPVGEIVTDDGIQELRELDGSLMAECDGLYWLRRKLN